MPHLRYWDSCAFLAWLIPEPDRVDACRTVLDGAKRGELRIVTSTLTLTEVIKVKGQPPLGLDKENQINGLFLNDWIVVQQLDRKTAEDARQLIWAHNVAPKDSVHVATALRSGASHLDTYDEGIKKLNGKLERELVIDEPLWTSPKQNLFDGSSF